MSIERTTEWFSIQSVCALFGESSSLRNMAWQAGHWRRRRRVNECTLQYLFWGAIREGNSILPRRRPNRVGSTDLQFNIMIPEGTGYGMCNNARWTGQRVGWGGRHRRSKNNYSPWTFCSDFEVENYVNFLVVIRRTYHQQKPKRRRWMGDIWLDSGGGRGTETHTHSLESWPPLIHLWLKFVCFSLPPLRPNPADGLLTVQWLYYRRMWLRLI